MKKSLTIIVIAILIVVGICLADLQQVIPYDVYANRVDPGQAHTARNEWVAISTVVAAGAEPANLIDTERTYQTVVTAIAAGVGGDEKIDIYDIPRSWNGVRFRCRGVTEGDNVVHYLYFGTLGDSNRHTNSTDEDCELTYAGILTWVLGDQVSIDTTHDEMADTLTVTAGDWNKAWSSQSPTSDRVAEAAIDLIGADVIIIVTQTSDCGSQLLAKGF